MQLQELCKNQVNELRTFVRSMRPVDVEGSLNATLRRVVEQFQKDSGIPATFVSAEFLEPSEPEVSLELLQIVREALYNVQKHSSATRVAVSIAKSDKVLEITGRRQRQRIPLQRQVHAGRVGTAAAGPDEHQAPRAHARRRPDARFAGPGKARG